MERSALGGRRIELLFMRPDRRTFEQPTWALSNRPAIRSGSLTQLCEICRPCSRNVLLPLRSIFVVRGESPRLHPILLMNACGHSGLIHTGRDSAGLGVRDDSCRDSPISNLKIGHTGIIDIFVGRRP